ncbi:50S ribosomal protein L27, partial [candidate division WOR-3 bacterium 4484_100]
TGLGNDFTIYARCAGRVKFGYKKGGKKIVSVIP